MSTISIDGWYDFNRDVERKEKETNTEEMNITEKNERENLDEKDEKNKERDDRLELLEKKMIELDQRQKHLETLIHTLTNENLKMINRVLEAEIALERSKNSLIRNHIPFHFSPSPLARSFGNM